jgi:glycosyltransferase involved in cell wall biosynthesis
MTSESANAAREITDMRLYLLDHTYAWWGRLAGFSALRPSLALRGCTATTVRPRKHFAARIAGKAYSTWNGIGRADQKMAAAEFEFLLRLKMSRLKGHVLYIEDHLTLLEKQHALDRWVGTINLPLRSWKPEMIELLRRAQSAIVLCEEHRDEFSGFIPKEKIYAVHHGVDTSFYSQAPLESSTRPHLIYVGAWLRNTRMFARLVPRIVERHPGVVFDCVVPEFARRNAAFAPLLNHPSVKWHQGLSDEGLRGIYRGATAMLMPMEDSGANNAILEALASGVPVVTTDTGGIRSYGGGSIYPVVRNNDDDACMELVERYLTDEEHRRKVGSACRDYAVSQLDWKVVAREFVAAYQKLGIV